MTRYLLPYVATGSVLLCLDLIWLRLASEAIFRPEVGPLLSDNPNLSAAALFYLLYVGGLVYFAVWPALNAHSLALAVLNGAVLGFIAYMTFDLTSLAILKGWSVKVAILDIAWGTFVSAVAASAGYAATVAFVGMR
ncbi:MAG: hypothetical protein RJB62_1747 [Pseudomonadota bacterium]|jgi:uncharacterized membrane protein